MKNRIRLFILIMFPLAGFAQSSAEIKRWERTAAEVTIVRDNWGIPHVYGKTDADAVFGLLYAQCEDDFPRIERNYLEKLGRLAEIDGKSALANDLLNRLVIDTVAAQKDFLDAPAWLQQLCISFADGINYYLHKHPETRPKLISHFEPWYPMMWTDGSIGAISTGGASTEEMAEFYGLDNASAIVKPSVEPDEAVLGSNGFAFSPKITASGNAILYINPHVTFYFRPEVEMSSEEGLHAYGAVTWGQFFVYQGFNEHCGWMHTSSAVDVADLYLEKITERDGKYFYQYNDSSYPVREKQTVLKYLDNGKLYSKVIKLFATGHGPVVAKRNGNWISLRANNRDRTGLIQSWQRTKAKSFEEYKQAMDLLANTSNNTVYADAEGNIAYWHGNFVPERDKAYDWTRPVDGSSPKTQWLGLHSINESVHLYNPINGWIQNCNATPFTAAGDQSPKRKDFPSYMAPDDENFRGLNAVRILTGRKNLTKDSVIALGYNRYCAAFEKLIPALVRVYGSEERSLYPLLAPVVDTLSHWDLEAAAGSVATTLAVEWGYRLLSSINSVPAAGGLVEKVQAFADTATAGSMLPALSEAVNMLNQNCGRWSVPWGEINRFQRLSGDIDAGFDDKQPSLEVPFVSSTWGMLPSYTGRYYPNTKKRYGVNGNSFICVVEFGKKVSAKSLLAGGESSHPSSPHFFDQSEMYAQGRFKDVLFYKEDVLAHAEKTYHPGAE